jgi:hypothetical protein
VAALATLVTIGLVVFLRRYRGADRTALALSLVVAAGAWLVAGLTWFHWRFSGKAMSRRELWGIGFRCGALTGVCTSGLAVGLLAVRWASDEMAGAAGEPFLPAFLSALKVLAVKMAVGFPFYVAVGAAMGALVGLAIAEAIGISARRLPPVAQAAPPDDEPMGSSGAEG